MADAAPTTPAAPGAPTKNCPSCKKPMKMKKRYYRNGKYYCNKNCFKTAQKAASAAPKEEKEKAAA